MYGAMGVKKGYLPFLQGAMCVTAKGRESIHKASNYLENECGGTVIYNDTDSAYTYFKCLEKMVLFYNMNLYHLNKHLCPNMDFWNENL
jgi:DNA polymerase elongation subunit (family B)